MGEIATFALSGAALAGRAGASERRVWIFEAIANGTFT